MNFATAFVFLVALFDAVDSIISARLGRGPQVVASVIVVGSDAGWCLNDNNPETDFNDCVNFSLDAKRFEDDTVKGMLVDVWVDRSVYRGDIDCLNVTEVDGVDIAIVSGILTGGPQKNETFYTAAKIGANGTPYYGPLEINQNVTCQNVNVTSFNFVEHIKGVVKIQGLKKD